jgi:4'-phosphopantetheinyl transferase
MARRALSILSNEECRRAERFRFDRGRTRFIAARAQLRRLLGAYLRRDPAELGFVYNEFGRPAFVDAFAPPGLRFNLSHADDLCLIAVAWDRDIGVDLEVTTKPLDVMTLAAQFFSSAEVAALRTLAPEARRRAFYTVWTQKEAFIKAMGDGLSRPLDSFDVSPQRRARGSLETRPDTALGRGFTLLQVDPGPGFAAALACEGDVGTLRFWTLAKTPHSNTLLERHGTG